MNENNDTRKYNGWANYETWAVKLWLDNEEASYRYWMEQAEELSRREDAAGQMARQLKEAVEEDMPLEEASLYADLLRAALSEVDWWEIAESYIDDCTECAETAAREEAAAAYEMLREEYFEDADDGEEMEGVSSRAAMCDGRSAMERTPHQQNQKGEDDDLSSEVSTWFGEVISRYTRCQAIADGVLVDVTETAKEAGFKLPVALTQAVWAQYVAVPEGVTCQDEAGRLWDIVWMCRCALAGSKPQETALPFSLHVRNDNRSGIPPLVTLKVVCGPDDDGGPCLTIMRPDED